MAKNDHVHLGGKVGRSDAIPTKFFSGDSYDLSFKFGNDTFITFEMPRVLSYRRAVGKMNISIALFFSGFFTVQKRFHKYFCFFPK